MLILSRKVGETIYIGDDVKVTVTGVIGGTVRIGIQAPRHIPINREEVAERIARGEPKPVHAL
jgi:carbon storage regulator